MPYACPPEDIVRELLNQAETKVEASGGSTTTGEEGMVPIDFHLGTTPRTSRIRREHLHA